MLKSDFKGMFYYKLLTPQSCAAFGVKKVPKRLNFNSLDDTGKLKS